MTITTGTIMALAIIIGLIITGLVIWRKNSENQTRSLTNIEKQLEEIGGGLRAESCGSILDNNAVAGEYPAPLRKKERLPKERQMPEGAESEAPGDSLNIAVALENSRADFQSDNSDKAVEKSISMYNVGKSGKIYTEEELDLLIKE